MFAHVMSACFEGLGPEAAFARAAERPGLDPSIQFVSFGPLKIFWRASMCIAHHPCDETRGLQMHGISTRIVHISALVLPAIYEPKPAPAVSRHYNMFVALNMYEIVQV